MGQTRTRLISERAIHDKRYCVRVSSTESVSKFTDYVRTVVVSGPKPDEAVVLVLEEIKALDKNWLWQSKNLRVDVEQVL